MVSEDDKSKLLNSLMRSGDPQERLKAIQPSDARREKQLEREAAERASRNDPIETLNEIAEIDPFYALSLARKHGLVWKPAPGTEARVLTRIEQLRPELQANGARARVDEHAGDLSAANGNGAT
jgi:hypothetical protein